MARHTDANNNIWFDPVTLSGSCSYVHIKDGCTGTVTDCNYVEIGEGNTDLALSGVDYCTIGNRNKTVTITDSDYIIVGSDSENIKIGSHSAGNTRYTGRTGGNSITVGHRTIGAEITGFNSKYDKSRNIQADGTFNSVVESGVVFLDNANGNEIGKSSRVDLKRTNNNSVETVNLNLTNKASFTDYALIDDVTRVKSKVPVINRQSDASGTILDCTLNKLTNEAGKSGVHYTKINGKWVEMNN